MGRIASAELERTNERRRDTVKFLSPPFVFHDIVTLVNFIGRRRAKLDARRLASVPFLFALASSAFLAPLACGTDGDNAAKSGADASADADASAPDAPSSCAPRCSSDLKKVLDCNDGKVLEVCSVEMGCATYGRCVDACEAATSAKGSVGCSFYTLPPDAIPESAGSCFAAILANTWNEPASISVDWGDEPLDISKSVYTETREGSNVVYVPLRGPLPPGQIAHVFLAATKGGSGNDFLPCPNGVTPALEVDPLTHGTGKEKAFRLKADKPVAAYSIFPFGPRAYSTSVTLLLPESASAKAFVGTVPSKIGANDGPEVARLRTMQIVAHEDDTEVAMRPVFDIAAGRDTSPAATGVTTTWTLHRGEALQITQPGIVSGSPIQTNKPIALFSGAPCAMFPSDVQACDSLQQQSAPLDQWGTEYALVPFRPRNDAPRESVPYTFVGAAAETVLTWSPAKPQGAPDKLAAGETVTFTTDAITTVRSQDDQHPFHAAVYMTGPGGGSSGPTQGDPEYVPVIASHQYLERSVFFVDGSLPETSLTVVRKKTQTGFKPVTLECGGELTGFQPISPGSDYEYAWIVLTKNGAAQPFPKGNCGYGRHVAESAAPFAITVWGVGTYASYGYAAGVGGRVRWQPSTGGP